MNPNLNFTQEELENIERYLNKTMPEEELVAFERKLQNNDSFKNQVADIKTLLSGIERQSLKEQLDIFHNELFESKKLATKNTKVLSFSFKKLIAAAVLILAIGSIWFFNQTSLNEKLYAQYFSPDPGLPTTMGKTINYEFYNAMVDYKQGNYASAISKWKVLLENNPKNDTLNYFVGVAYLAQKQEEPAISHLNIVTENSQSKFSNEAFYYLGLAYLKANNLELSKKNLTFSTFDNSKTLLSKLND